MVTVNHADSGSWKCGKGFAFTTFPHPYSLSFERELPDKFTMQVGERNTTRVKPPQKQVLAQRMNTNLTII